MYWTDNSSDETGFVVEKSDDGSNWIELGRTQANITQFTIQNFDRSTTTELRIRAIKETNFSEASEKIRLVGTSDTLEVYPAVPRISTPRTLTQDGITFSEIQDQTPSQPEMGKATRISTFFTAEVRGVGKNEILSTPVYETRPQIRNNLPQNDPTHTKVDGKPGHLPYGYTFYGPSTEMPSYKLHSKHWTNFDSAENIVVRVKLLDTANYPGPINVNDLDIQPAPLSVEAVDSTTIDITLPGATDFTRHYRVAVNRDAWSSLSGRGVTVTEAPLFIFVNPMQLAPASAPVDQIKEFKSGALVVFGPGIHLPNKKYQFLGDGENNLARELYVPGDAYLHYGFLFKNDNYPVKLYGRGIFSDEMFNIYTNAEEGKGYKWSTPNRTPWAAIDAIEGNIWDITQSWDTHAWIVAKYHAEPTVFEGLTSIGARMGIMVQDSNAEIINYKDVGYGGGTYQAGTTSKVKYKGCLLTNDDDITYVHENYTMDHCTTYVMSNGPSFQIGWEGKFNLAKIPTKVTNHTIISSDRRATSFGKNHGVFNSRLGLPTLQNHSGGVFENFEFWGKESIIFNMRIWDEDPTSTTVKDSISILGDKTFKNFTIRNASYNKERIDTETNLDNNRKGYIRFIHFDNLKIAGQAIDNIDQFTNYFSYNDGLLLHTMTLFSLPEKIAQPTAGTAPIGQTIVIQAMGNSKYLLTDSSLPVSLSPLVANDSFLDANTALNIDNGYTIVDAGDGYVALKASNGHYVKADPERYGYVYTLPDTRRGDSTAKTITEDAKFVWVDTGGGTFALYSKSMGLYVRTDFSSSNLGPLYAASATLTDLEKFTIAGYTVPVLENTKLLIEGEDWASQVGVTKTAANDTSGGGFALGGVHNGDTATYNVAINNIQSIKSVFRVSAAGAGGSIEVYDGAIKLTTITVPNTGGWNNWISIEKEFTLPNPNMSSIQLKFVGGTGFLLNVNWFELELVPN